MTQNEHSCGGYSNEWRVLASLVTKGSQLQASDIIAESLRVVDFASLVLVAHVMCELHVYALIGCSTQCECTIVMFSLPRIGAGTNWKALNH